MIQRSICKLNFPNLLSMLRIFCVPIFFLIYYYYLVGEEQMLWPTRWLLLFIVFSDFLDGFLARHWHEVTRLGSILDPLADKLFIIASYILLSVFDQIPAWLVIIVVSKDIMVSIGWCGLAVLYNKFEVSPSLIGKSATALQYLTICVIVLFPPWYYIYGLELLTALVTSIVLVHYSYHLLLHQNGKIS